MSQAAAPRSPSRREFDSIQILRAVAALAVVFFHLFSALQIDFKLFDRNPFMIGANGVDIFFVISGFIISYAAASDTSPLRFALKRIFRIVPLYYTLTIGLFAVAAAFPNLLNTTSADPLKLLKSLLFVPYMRDDGMVQPLLFLGWTLNYEMFFYALFALSMYVSRRPAVLCSGVICALVAIGHAVQFESVALNFYSNGIMLSFVWGSLAYLAFRHAPEWVGRLKPLWPLAAALILVQNWYPVPLAREYAFGLPSTLLLLSLLSMRPVTSLLGRAFKTIGDASYSLYLIHPYVLQAFVKIILPVFGISLVSIAVFSTVATLASIAVAVFLYFAVERPSNRWLRMQVLRPAPVWKAS